MMGIMAGRRRALLKAEQRSRTGLLEPHVLTLKVGLRDHDLLGHMTNSRYNELTALAREDFFIHTGLQQILQTHEAKLEVQYEAITFRRMLRSGMTLDLITQLAGWSPAYVFFKHAFRVGETVKAEAICIAGFRGAANTATDAAALISESGHKGSSPPHPTEFESALSLLATDPPER